METVYRLDCGGEIVTVRDYNSAIDAIRDRRYDYRLTRVDTDYDLKCVPSKRVVTFHLDNMK